MKVNNSKGNVKKTDKIRRKLLIGAAATPLILTLHATRAWAGYNVREWMTNPSKASREGDWGYSGILEGSGGGTAQTELGLYVLLMESGTTTSATWEGMKQRYNGMIDELIDQLNALADAVHAAKAELEGYANDLYESGSLTEAEYQVYADAFRGSKKDAQDFFNTQIVDPTGGSDLWGHDPTGLFARLVNACLANLGQGNCDTTYKANPSNALPNYGPWAAFAAAMNAASIAAAMFARVLI